MDRKFLIAIVLTVALAIGLVVLVTQSPDGPVDNPPAVDQRVDAVSEDPRAEIRKLAMSCTTDMATTFHIHPTLSIIVNGKKQVLPANIGITAGCMSPLHTHDAFGEIHVESPKKVDFTLGDFFMVWGKTFTKDQILDSKADATHVVTMKVNGKVSEEFENLVLVDDDVIVIEYGKK